MNKKLIAVAVFILFVAAFGWFFQKNKNTPAKISNAPKETGEIVFGFNGDQLSSSIAGLGVAAREGFTLAVDEINASGGILGRPVKAVALDDQADKELSKKNMEQLIFRDKALAVVGPTNSTNALYWLDLAQENKTIVIVPIATASEITQRYARSPKNYIFRLTSLDNDQIRLYVSWLIKKTNNGRIAIINDETSYGLKGLKDVSEVLARWGKTPVFTSSFGNNASLDSVAKIIAEAKKTDAEGIIFFSYPDSTASLLKAAEKIKDYNPVIVGTTASIDQKLWELAGASSEKLIFVSGTFLDQDEAKIAFKKKMTEKFGHEPYSIAPAMFAYDAVNLLKASIDKAGIFDPPAVQTALENIDNIQGVSKLFQKPFDKENHEAFGIKDLYLAHWQNGKIVKINEDASSLETK